MGAFAQLALLAQESDENSRRSWLLVPTQLRLQVSELRVDLGLLLVVTRVA
jgi:hypothetical protein